MSFFSREKSSLRRSSQLAYDYNQQYHDMLDGLNGDLTFGDSSVFASSPYEMFRKNVAKYCERFMYSSFDQEDFLSAQEKSSRGLRRGGETFDERLAEGDASWCAHADMMRPGDRESDDFQAEFIDEAAIEENRDCYCSRSIICEHCRARPTKSQTNLFSVMSVSFKPVEHRQPRKRSLLQKITHFMNSDFNSHKEKVAVSRKVPLKMCEPSKWNACECHVHIGKHSNCCQCQEPYHRTNCECVQHNGSHSYCCRCDPHLLQEYDQHLKKKRYLRLLSNDEELSLVNSVDNVDGNKPINILKVDGRGTENACPGRKFFPRNQAIFPDLGEKPCKEKDHDAEESTSNHHPCESCCRKLDKIYGTALREVHSMLMDVSRTLLPSAHCCSLETRIQNVSRLRPSFSQVPQSLETVESNVAEPEWAKDVSATTEIGVQVTPNELICEEQPKRKTSKKMKCLKNKCVVS